MVHVRSKTRSLDHILENPCVRSRGHIFSPIIMKLGQNVCLYVILDELENESCWIKNKVTRSNLRKRLLINDIPHNLESLGEGLQGHRGPLVKNSFYVVFRLY